MCGFSGLWCVFRRLYYVAYVPVCVNFPTQRLCTQTRHKERVVTIQMRPPRSTYLQNLQLRALHVQHPQVDVPDAKEGEKRRQRLAADLAQ